MKHIGAFLKQKRQEVGLTQRQVADHFNLSSTQFVSNWERGLCLPPQNYLPKLCELYHLNKNALIEVILDQNRSDLENIFTSSRATQKKCK